jgi:hypothetical protein
MTHAASYTNAVAKSRRRRGRHPGGRSGAAVDQKVKVIDQSTDATVDADREPYGCTTSRKGRWLGASRELKRA